MLLVAILGFGILTLWVPGRWALTSFQVAIFALAAARIISKLRTHRTIGLHGMAIILALVPMWGVVQILLHWTVDSFRTSEEVLNWTTNVTAFALAFDTAQDSGQRSRFLQGAAIFAGVLSIFALLTMFSSPPGTVFWRFDIGTDVPTFGPFVYRNQYAAFVEALLPVSLLGAIVASSSNRGRSFQWLYLLSSALLFASVVAAGSRTGSILCLLEVIAIPLLARIRGLITTRSAAWALLGSLAALAIFTTVAGWGFLWARFQESSPFSLRADLLRSSIEMVRARPWTGFGIGTWSAVYPGYARFDDGLFVNQAHNDWAQWASEGGIPLLLLMLVFVCRIIRPAFKSLWGIGIVVVFLHCMVDYPMQQRPALATFFFSVVAILVTDGGKSVPNVKDDLLVLDS